METVLVSADHVLTIAPPLLVQVRRGPMTLDVLELIEQQARTLRRRFAEPKRRVAFASILEEGAPVASNEVRARQRVLIETLMEGLDARIVVAVMGDGVSSMLQRSVARGLMFAHPRVRVAKSPEDAAAWIAPHLGLACAQVVSAIQRTRDLR